MWLKPLAIVWIVMGLVGFIIRMGNREAWPKWHHYPVVIPTHIILGVISIFYGLNCLNSKKYSDIEVDQE